MNEMQSADLFEAAARATINGRCAAAFLHDVRGSMQALFSAFDLLGRSARLGGGDASRVEKACDLAKRAIAQHEKSTMDILALLTLQQCDVALIDLGALVNNAVHFLRNDAGTKGVVLKSAAAVDLPIQVARAKLQTMLVGLLTAAIDHTPPGSELLIEVGRAGEEASVSIPSDAGFDLNAFKASSALASVRPSELILQFAQQLMTSSGGRLEIDHLAGTDGVLKLYFPLAVSADSLAASRALAIEK